MSDIYFLFCLENQTNSKRTMIISQLSAMPLVTSFISNQQFTSGNLTYNVYYFFHLLLLYTTGLKRCEKTGEVNIECPLFIIHRLKRI